MSFSFKQFLSTLGAAGSNTSNPDGSGAPQQAADMNAADVDGGYAPVLLYDPTSPQVTKPHGDSPGTNSLYDTPLVFSKASDFISATLSCGKLSGGGAPTAPTQCSDTDNSVGKCDSVVADMEDSDLTTITDQLQHATVGENGCNELDENITHNSDDVDSKSALKMPYAEEGSDTLSEKITSGSSSTNWRQGTERSSGESSKTMFISQNLTKAYDKADAQMCKGSKSYDVLASKVMREMVYFEKILHVVGNDLRNSEHTNPADHVLVTREKIRNKMAELVVAANKFMEETLAGDVRTEPPRVQGPTDKEEVEYVHPPEKKSAKEAKAELCLENVDVTKSLHKCSDCLHYIIVGEGENLESALEKHMECVEHKNSEESGGVAGRGSTTATTTNAKLVKESSVKKVVEKGSRGQVNHTQSRQMMLNQVTSQVVDGQVMLTCNPCQEVLSVDGFGFHVNTNTHKSNLNNFNIRLQKDLMIKFPDLFGQGKTYCLTDLHIVMNKIFVDPIAKYTYCGLCRKELPSKQLNIEEHITSKHHEKLLLTSMEGRVSKAQQKEERGDVTSRNTRELNTDSSSEGVKQQRRASGTLQPYDIEEKDKVYAATSLDGKFVCLLCDARGITSVQNLISHFNGGPHKANLEHAKSKRGELDPDTQYLFIRNMMCVTYGRFPLVFECLACHSPPFTGLQTAVEHLDTPHHLTALSSRQQEQRLQNARERTERRPSVATSVILHRNGVNFWCLVCRCELQDISSAYSHVLLPGHPAPSVDGVLMLQLLSQYICEHCNVFINSEKNAGQHIVSTKHRLQVASAPSKSSFYRDTKVLPSLSRSQVRRAEEAVKPTPSADDGKMKLEERILLHKNFVNILKKNCFQCKLCESEQMNRSKILTHIFSYEHVLKMQAHSHN